ncbi:hypothetical protein V8G54_006411 [Vigna mungo]|uniref:Uncharacterized protein n=1 Tax=Vigna mungo TaxID=3915 RepID=A0AAQ3S4I7_VIGMU
MMEEKMGRGIICEVGIEERELYCRKACVCEGVVATWDGTVNKKEEKVEGKLQCVKPVGDNNVGDVEKGGTLMGMCREWKLENIWVPDKERIPKEHSTLQAPHTQRTETPFWTHSTSSHKQGIYSHFPHAPILLDIDEVGGVGVWGAIGNKLKSFHHKSDTRKRSQDAIFIH